MRWKNVTQASERLLLLARAEGIDLKAEIIDHYSFRLSRKGRPIDWVTGKNVRSYDIDDFFVVGELAERIGLKWGGRRLFRDIPIFSIR